MIWIVIVLFLLVWKDGSSDVSAQYHDLPLIWPNVRTQVLQGVDAAKGLVCGAIGCGNISSHWYWAMFPWYFCVCIVLWFAQKVQVFLKRQRTNRVESFYAILCLKQWFLRSSPSESAQWNGNPVLWSNVWKREGYDQNFAFIFYTWHIWPQWKLSIDHCPVYNSKL